MSMRWLHLLLLVALAGCSTPDGPGDSPTAPPNVPDETRPLEANGTLTFGFTNVETPATDFNGSVGCFIDAPDLTHVVNGTVTLTWTPAATTPTLHLGASSAGPGIVSTYADAVEGPPPLALSFTDVAVPESLSFTVRSPEPGVAYEQEVTLSWALVYEGRPSPAWAEGSCPG